MTRTILFNHSSPYPNAVTGITVYSWKILEALAKSGNYKYVLVTNWNEDRLPNYLSNLGIRVIHRANPRNETLAWLNENLKISKLVRDVGADLVFSPHPFSAAVGAAPRVLVVHDLRRVQYPQLNTWRSRLQWNLLFALCLRRAAAAVAVSRTTRDAIAKYYPWAADKVYVAQEASPLVSPPARPARPKGEPYGLMVANITPIKRLSVLTNAMRILLGKGKKATVVLVGRNDSNDKEVLRAQADGLDLRIVNSASDEDLINLYFGASFYVNTSILEGFCLPILEAQTLDCPIICSDLPVLREVAGEGAIYFPPEDSAALADAMQRLLDNPEEAARLRAAGAANAAMFSWERAARETEAAFDAALAARGRRKAARGDRHPA